MNSNTPNISIVIPTYNRPERLEQCLQSLTQLQYPHNRFEVIIVDDGSTTPLEPVLARFVNTLPLHSIRQKNAGPASARNTGAAVARGHYLAFTDDDCQPAPDWLIALERAITDAPDDALIGGKTLNALPKNLYSSASQLLIDYIYEYYNQDRSQAMFFASNNFAMPRGRFQELGGFDTSFPLAAGEDREFCDRWRYHRLPLYFSPAMQIRHAHTLAPKSFWRQHFNYGRGAYHFHQARSQRDAEPIQVEPLAFYWQLVTYPFIKKQGGVRAIALSALFFLSQAGTVAGFFWERTQAQTRIAQGT